MEDFSDLLDGKTHFFGDLMREGLPSEILREFVRDLCDLLDRLDHVSWYVNSSRLLADRPSHGLAYPPYSIGTEPVAHPTVELLRRFHEPHIPLLHEVGKGKAAVHVLFCHGYDQSEVRFGEHVPCFDILLLCPLDPLNKLLQLGCGDARLHLSGRRPSLTGKEYSKAPAPRKEGNGRYPPALFSPPQYAGRFLSLLLR